MYLEACILAEKFPNFQIQFGLIWSQNLKILAKRLLDDFFAGLFSE